jgi:class 3 adenylate cyclase
MPEERGTRKLAAILAADAVGYSRMMSADEEGTLRVLAGHRAIIDRIIALHEGRIVGTAGDSVLAEFASPVLAVRCAVEMQEALKTRNQSLAPASQMLFRVGINLGDVVVAGDDLLGDGVNVAARLESIAEPGGICISSSVYDQISGKLNLGLQDIGEQNLKNISRPIRVYRIAGTGAPTRARPATHPRRSIGLGRVVGGLAVVVAAGVFAWRAGWLAPEPDQQERAAAAADAKRADVELAQAKAAAEAAQRRAAEETAAAAEARRALEAQRAAETKARAEAELARARADAEAMKRKAAAELAAAEKTRADSERAAAASAARSGPVVEPPAAPVPIASNYDGVWSAARTCSAYKDMAAFSDTVSVSVAHGEFVLEHGTPGQPGYILLRGMPDAGGSLALRGGAIAGHPSIRGKPIPASFEGRREDDRFVLNGGMGQRKCTLVLRRTVQTAVGATNAPSPYDGNWMADRNCEAYMERPAIEDRLPVTVSHGEFTLERGESGEPGYLRIQGRPDADGTLVMSGNGIAGIAAIRGKKYPAFFEGHLESGRFVMQGTLGRRSCTLVIGRAN